VVSAARAPVEMVLDKSLFFPTPGFPLTAQAVEVPLFLR